MPLRCMEASNHSRTLGFLAPFSASRLAALCLRAGRESHDCCSPVSAESKLNIPADHPERPASPTAAAGAPRRPIPFAGHRRRRSSLALTVLTRRRIARDFLDARRRDRAASRSSRFKGLGCARFACAAFRMSCRNFVCLCLCRLVSYQ